MIWMLDGPLGATQRSSISSCREASYWGMSPGTCILTRGTQHSGCVSGCMCRPGDVHILKKWILSTYVCMCDMVYIHISIYIYIQHFTSWIAVGILSKKESYHTTVELTPRKINGWNPKSFHGGLAQMIFLFKTG